MTSIKVKEYIDHLLSKGEISFSTQQMQKEMIITPKAMERAIYRLRKKGELVSPARGYYLILTPEFRKMGCLPPDYFIDDLMNYWQQNYYVGLMSAALYHGAAHQQPQVFQVVTDRYHSSVKCGRVRIEFILKQTLKSVPTQKLKTHTGYMTTSTPAATMMDLVKFLRRSGGLGHVATITDELADSVVPEDLTSLLKGSSERSWMQRLGFILDYLGHAELANVVYQRVSGQKMNIVPLVPYQSKTGVKRNQKWRIAINTIVESDTNDPY